MKKKRNKPISGGKKVQQESSLKPKEQSILGFKKSRHFSKQQKKRKIDDPLLARILWHVNPPQILTTLIIRQSEILHLAKVGKIDITYSRFSRDLVIVIHGSNLVTCFSTIANNYVSSSSIQSLQYVSVSA